MTVLCERYFGQLVRCKCGAIIAYKPEEVNRACTIRCPICTDLITVLFDPNYEGVVKDGKAVVSEQSGAGESDCGS